MGGNMNFGKRTFPIDKIDIKPTIANIIRDFNIIFKIPYDNQVISEYLLLGSSSKASNKEICNDIDLGIDSKSFDNPSKWDLREDEMYLYSNKLEMFTKRARTATKEELQRRALLYVIANKLNNSGYFYVNLNKITKDGFSFAYKQNLRNNEEKYVQVDILIGDLDFMQFSYTSNYTNNSVPFDENIKGLHRTQLFVAILDKLGYSFSATRGFRLKNSNDFLKLNNLIILFDDVFSAYNHSGYYEEDMNNYHSLIDIISEHHMYSDIIDIYLNILDKTRCDIPLNLHEYYINNKERLSLSGKFLPNDSKLKV